MQQHLTRFHGIAVIADTSVPFDRLKAICAQMTKATQDFRKYLGEVKELHARQIDRIQRERDAALMAARVHADVDDPNNIHQMPGVEIATTKKVCAIDIQSDHSRYANAFFSPDFRIFSAQIATARHWPSAHCADERHIVPHFANERIGMPIKWNAPVIPMKAPNKLCCWSTSKHNINFPGVAANAAHLTNGNSVFNIPVRHSSFSYLLCI